MSEMLAIFVHPLVLTRTQQLFMLLPLCLSISIVYKAIKVDDVRQLPAASLVSWGTIVIGMYSIGIGLLLLYEWMA
jgi:hypothetical protein